MKLELVDYITLLSMVQDKRIKAYRIANRLRDSDMEEADQWSEAEAEYIRIYKWLLAMRDEFVEEPNLSNVEGEY